MRPGLLCPGKEPLRVGHGLGLARFNEAGAVMPRKVPSSTRSLTSPEIASMRPGLLCPGKKRRYSAMGGRSSASMRPGLLCPGKYPVPCALRFAPGGFNEAGAVMPRKGT